jgi:hypothetical protein
MWRLVSVTNCEERYESTPLLHGILRRQAPAVLARVEGEIMNAQECQLVADDPKCDPTLGEWLRSQREGVYLW